MTKKIIYICMTLILLVTAGCSISSEGERNSGKVTIITSVFPPYDFVKAIAGELAEVSILLPPGAESHSFEPTPKDIIAIKNADLFIYTGGEGDQWIQDFLNSIGKDGPKTLRMMDCVTPLEEEIPEGAVAEEHDEEAHEKEYDEHVWTSPKNAELIMTRIAEELSTLDEKNRKIYQANRDAYALELEQLDRDYQEMADNAARKTIVVGDRFPFRYMADAYGLDYYAAFPGCSSESEASAATLAFLIEKVKEEKIPAVIYIEFSTRKIADTIADATGVPTLMVHSCHNVSAEDLASGVTYISLMRNNLDNLRKALY